MAKTVLFPSSILPLISILLLLLSSASARPLNTIPSDQLFPDLSYSPPPTDMSYSPPPGNKLFPDLSYSPPLGNYKLFRDLSYSPPSGNYKLFRDLSYSPPPTDLSYSPPPGNYKLLPDLSYSPSPSDLSYSPSPGPCPPQQADSAKMFGGTLHVAALPDRRVYPPQPPAPPREKLT